MLVESALDPAVLTPWWELVMGAWISQIVRVRRRAAGGGVAGGASPTAAAAGVSAIALLVGANGALAKGGGRAWREVRRARPVRFERRAAKTRVHVDSALVGRADHPWSMDLDPAQAGALGRLYRRAGAGVEGDAPQLQRFGRRASEPVGWEAIEATVGAMLRHYHPYTRWHSERVGLYAAELTDALRAREPPALAFRLPSARWMQVAGRVHDVGKLAMPKWVLDWTEPRLPREGMRQVRAHPGRGAALLAPIPAARSFLPAVLAHHENFDGTGYPYGLAGREIPLEARILRVVDAFDAMTSTRSYQKALGERAAVDRLKELSGTAFDPDLVEAFTELLETNERVRATLRAAQMPSLN